MIHKKLVEDIIKNVDARTKKFREILRDQNFQIKDKETKEMRAADEHEQLEAARKVLGQGYTFLQKVIVEQFEGGQLGKRLPRNQVEAQITETVENTDPNEVVNEMTPSEECLIDNPEEALV